MPNFSPLFTLGIEHSFFVDGVMRGVDFVPSPATAAVIRSVGLMVKRIDNGIAVICAEDRLPALPLHAADGATLNFAFVARVGDKNFPSYTYPLVPREEKVLCFGNVGRDAERLTEYDEASEADYRDVAALIDEGVLNERERRVLPDFVVILALKVAPGEAGRAPDFCIRFAARKSFWKYYLLGKMGRDSARIVDLDNKVEFESRGEVVLPGNRRSQLFMSTSRVSLAEKSQHRFQLREADRQGDRILVRRLPVASESRLGLEVIDGKREVVFENYVNF
ncbi:MAG TPA: hypothetical protein VI279_06405 [Rhodocyclaceae bacterium]